MTTGLQAVAIADRALALACDHVRTRRQYGQPISSFQVVQHRLADAYTSLSAARLLVDDAANVAADRAVLADAAARFAVDVAERTTLDVLQLHGASGYLRTSEIPALVESAVALATQAPTYADIGTSYLALPPDGWWSSRTTSMTASHIELRREMAAELARLASPERLDRVHASGAPVDRDVLRSLASRGWLAPELDGQVEGRAWVACILTEELGRAGIPVHGSQLVAMVAYLLRDFGTDAQRDRWLASLLAGDIVCCLGYSEPDAGSDVAAVTTAGVQRDDGRWTLSGTKLYVALAEVADVMVTLVRTTVGSERHRGLSVMLVPMDSPGITVTSIASLGGEVLARVELRDVEVTDDAVLGEAGRGWAVLMGSLAYERNGVVAGLSVRLLDLLVRTGRAAADTIGLLATETRASQLLGENCVTSDDPADGSVAKLFSTEAYKRHAHAAVAAVAAPDADAGAADPVSAIWRAYRGAPAWTISSGTSEVQRNIIARAALGLEAG